MVVSIALPVTLVPTVPAIAPRSTIAALAIVACLHGCGKPPPSGYQGYVEGEFVNVASPIAGRLDQLSVKRGDVVTVNRRLYALEAVQRSRRAAAGAGAGEGGAKRSSPTCAPAAGRRSRT